MVRHRMLRCSACILVGIFGLFAEPVTLPAAEPPEVPGFERVKVGMTAADAKRTLGPPARIVRQILYRRQLAQWTYDGKFPFWIEVEHVKGQEARVRAVHPLRAAKN